MSAAEAIATTPDGYADPAAVIRRSMLAWKPPPRLSLSAWAEKHYVLSSETSAEPGRWKAIPYQVGMMDAITDPIIEQVTVMKSARVGFTLIMCGAIGYFIHQDPSGMLVVQPTVEDSKNFSKESIAGLLRDVPVLRGIVFKEDKKGAKDGSNTLTHKKFPGGVLSLTGANSGTGFRRIGRRVLLGDEVDAYPLSAGSEGDPLSLAKKRTQAYWNRKIVIGSTPLSAGTSRIAEEFEKGDQRRYYVPCPHCPHMDFLVFREKGGPEGLADRGHYMKWDEGKPETAHFICRKCGCVIEHKDKRWMVERGEWRAAKPFHGHASFHIWAAYSYAPNASWAQLAEEFIEANAGGPEKLKTFVNTVLGETWVEKGEAPDWQRLFNRRELYPLATVPAGVALITAGVDVQRDRLVWEVVGWGLDMQSWTIDAGVIPGDTSKEVDGPWDELDKLIAHRWPGPDGLDYGIQITAVDSGFNTQVVYNWARRYPMSRVIACKGVATQRTLLGSPSDVDVTIRGKRHARGYKVWPVGVDVVKGEFYGFLQLEPPTKPGVPFPRGYCHHPELGADYFKQITAEHLVRIVNKRRRFSLWEWQLLPGRENHWLDCRVYARAAANLAQLDRLAAAARGPPPAPPPPAAPPAPPESVGPADAEATAREPEAPTERGGWLSGAGGGRVGSGWLSRRR